MTRPGYDSSYMYRPKPLLHVIRGEQIVDAGQLEQEIVLEPEHGCGSDYCRLREDGADGLLASGLLMA